MRVNPVLVDVIRGDIVESRHRGAYAVCDADGRVLQSAGDIDTCFFPRSSLKLIQALPLIETGAAVNYGLGSEEIVLAAASHAGDKAHTDRIVAWLQRLGLSKDDLQCGLQKPFSDLARAQLRKEGREPSPVHNNNSGKHAAFLTTALFHREPVDSYLRPDHPVQARVKASIERMIGKSLAGASQGVERCGMPIYAISLTDLARGMARLCMEATGSSSNGNAASVLLSSIRQFPELIAGQKRLSTIICQRSAGQIIVKGGSEGIFSGMIPSHGVGFALKIDDGAQRAADIALLGILDRLLPDFIAGAALGDRMEPPVQTSSGDVIGKMQRNRKVI